MDKSLLGGRVLDVLRAVDYALTRSDVDPRGVRAIGAGRGANWLLFAAALDQRVQAAVCDRGLISYKSLAQTDRYLYGADLFAPEILEHFDLPQVAAAMADRPLSLLSPLGPMKKPVEILEAAAAYGWASQTYRHTGSRLLLKAHDPELPLADQYLRALG